jgi:tripeptidyl-peptidase-2
MDVEEETQRRRVEFEMLLNLKSTVPWVQCPDHFMLMHNGRSFKIEVDPTQLPPGVHTAKVMGYDSTNSTAHNNRGAIFSVPITVVRTLKEEPDIRIGKLEVGYPCFNCVSIVSAHNQDFVFLTYGYLFRTVLLSLN